MKTKREISRIVLEGLFWTGAIAIAWNNPYFLHCLVPKLVRHAKYKLRKRKNIKAFQRSFYYLKQQGLINFEYRGKQVHISLTREGRRKVKKYNIDNLKITKPKKWDKKWRILIFDIQDKYKIRREALRGKLKELGFYKLQKSVWVCPYDFQREVEILRDFFNFNYREMRVITANEVEAGEEIRSFFRV
jgi:CRISPR-associated endonuclease Cas2